MGVVLSYCKVPHPKTNIMYRCNFAYTQLNVYLTNLLEQGLLRQYTDEYGMIMYTTTPKGILFLNHVEQAQEIAGLVSEN